MSLTFCAKSFRAFTVSSPALYAIRLSVMGFLLALAVMGGGVKLPPVAPFVVGASEKRQFSMIVTGSEMKKMTVKGSVTQTCKALEADGTRVYNFVLDPTTRSASQSLFELTTNSKGTPISCRQLGDVQSDATNALLFMIRQPLLPSTSGSSSWAVKLAVPSDASRTFTIRCSARAGARGSVLINQSLEMDKWTKGLTFRSELRVNTKSGNVMTVHEVFESRSKKEWTKVEYSEQIKGN